MKKIFTFICLLFIINLTAQNRQIVVKAIDHCYAPFSKSVIFDLYKINGVDTTYLTSSSSNPSTFSGLSDNGFYLVKIGSIDQSPPELSLKDLHYTRSYILGVIKGSKATYLSGDYNNDDKFTTLDLVLWGRILLGFPNQFDNRWFFMPSYLFLEDNNNKHVNKAYFNAGVNYAEFIAFNKGDISATYFDCKACPSDTSIINSVVLPSIDLTKEQSFEFDINYDLSSKNLGFIFSLQYENLEILSISPIKGTSYYHDEQNKTITFLNTFFTFPADPLFGVAKINVKAKTDDNLKNMIFLNPNYKHEAIFEGKECTSSSDKFTIKYIDFKCGIAWPADITIPDCVNNYNTGSPIIEEDCKDYSTVSYSDLIIGNPCEKIIRTWTSVFWPSSELSTHVQNIFIQQGYKPVCIDNASVLIDTTITLYAKDFLKSSDMNSQFSFDPVNYTPFKKFTYSKPFVEELSVYDFASKQFCITKLTKLDCKNGTVLVKNELSIYHGGQDNYVVTGDMFKSENATTCLGVISDFEISLLSPLQYASSILFPKQQYKGTSIFLKLRYKLNGNYVNYGNVKVNFSNDNTEALLLSCYDDYLDKDVPFEIVFSSPNFNQISGLQGGILLKDAVLTSSNGSKLNDIFFNPKSNSLKFIWVAPQGSPLNFNPNDSLFSMTIVPSKSGYVSQFVSLSDSLLSSEAVKYTFETTQIDLAFSFLQRTSTTDEKLNASDVNLFPNPNNGDFLTITSPYIKNSIVKISDLNGRVLSENKLEGNETQQLNLPQDIPNGLYLVEISTSKGRVTKKLIIAN